MKNVVLSAKKLSIGYASGNQTICTNINFELHKGEMICLLGRNGVGKSTLLKTLASMIPFLDGKYYINNHDASNISQKIIAKNLAIVLTEKLPENSLTVYETIALGRQPYTNWLGVVTEQDQHIIRKAMQLTNTSELHNQLVSTLSDGQLQRVMIARALAQETPIILLDEPTSHLDIHHKINVFKILKKITKETNKTVLISTHEINLALKHSSRLMLIHQNNFNVGKCSDNSIQQQLISSFNSDDIQYDIKTNQFIF
ncbi:ABC transporter ATP-binding protein [Wenyingzhuangia sp. IMCC45533]